ncbi:oligopeptidase B Serine peptidase. MEROPS family S09A [Chryseobacterium oranimense]|uniref:prolyl oligopeptidase n=1 Tax=Chryseobacterium oranimense TaxID=421058 RepID=A0A1M5X4U5_9FLAO|nr:prolyl oligopeptidase family serine peptidase [Chryseobacterium oranimense]SHH94233.1 oligopeptidase B Serine peptidase. MEROPS family S09A [Chryseobacterium oranimense]
MRSIIFIITVLFVGNFYSQNTNLAPSVPVTEKYFGTQIVDEYRNLEDLEDPAVSNWMKSQTGYADLVLDKIPNRKYYLETRLKLDERQGYSVSDLKITGNDKYFYLKRNAEEKTSRLYFKSGLDGREELLYDPSDFKTGNNFIINVISPSWNGERVAISLTEKGKELSEIIIMDVKTKYIHPEIITNTNPANIGGIKWLEDNSGFFYVYYPVIENNSNQFGKNTQAILYKIGEDPKKLNDVFSNINNPDLKIGKEELPVISAVYSDEKYYLGMLVGAENFRKTFIIDKKDLLNGKKNWKILFDKDVKVYFVRLSGDDIYFLSGYDSPNFKLCKTNVNSLNFKKAEILIPEKKDEVITQYVLTKDGIYFTTSKNGVEAKLYLYKDGKEIPILLPYVSGNINLQSKGRNFSDIWVSCSGWANEEQRFRYNLANNTFKLENLAPVAEYPEFKDIAIEEVVAKSHDGIEVPLSLIYNKNLKRDGKAPVLMDSYGAYGVSKNPFFAKSFLLWANQGGVIAVAHVRGGGEKGEEWHLGAYKETKANSWKDLIACAQYLIDKKFTSAKKIAILGGSAGGITTGRAMTERPDLFGAVIIEAGVLNALRSEKNGIGGTDVSEYGSVNNPKEFRGILEMDAYQHIKKGVKYPATLICTGINDPRIAPWQSTKFVAKLLADNKSNKPVLLKIDYEGGHGGGAIPIKQRYSNLSDIFAFAFWQLGHPDYQPNKEIKK